MTKPYFALCSVALALLASTAVLAATATFDYDALGRLSRVSRDDGKVENYELDAAGNRKQVVTGTLPGVPSSISVPSGSTTGAYTINWGAASGTVTAYELYEATSASFSGQTQVYSGTALSAPIAGRTNGTYYYRVRACFDSDCRGYRVGANGVTVSVVGPPPIQILNPSIQVGTTGQLTQITTLANLNGHVATIHSVSETCTTASVAMQSGAQAIFWTNNNLPQSGCAVGYDEYCSASYDIRDTDSGQTYSGMASITVVAQTQSPPPGEECP